MRFIMLLVFLMVPFTSKAFTNMDASLYLGPSLFQSGNIQDLGSPNMNTSLDFNYYFQEQHGLGVSFGNEFDFDGKSKYSVLKDGSIHTFDIHYVFRKRFEDSKFRISFMPGFGWQTLYDEAWDYYWGYTYYDDLSSSWVLNYKLMLDYVIKEWNTDGNDMEFFTGVGVTQIFSFNDSLYGSDISGSRFSGLFRLGFGF